MKDGGPAFPVNHLVAMNGEIVNVGATGGMSLRDYMATHIIAGMVANPATTCSSTDPMRSIKILCESAYMVADNLLKEREAKHE